MIVEKYNYVLKQELEKHGVYHQAHRLLQTFHSPLLPKEEKEFEKLDRIQENAMKKAERKCRKLKMGKYQWTPDIQAMRDNLKYLTLSLSRKKGCHVGARVLINLSKKAKVSVVNWSIGKIEKEIYEMTSKFNKMKKHHIEHHKSYLEDLAITLAKQKKTTKSAMVKQ